MEKGTEASEEARNEASRRRKLITGWASALAACAAGVTILFSINTFFKAPKDINPRMTGEVAVLENLGTHLEQDRKTIEYIQMRINALINTDQKTSSGQQLAAVRAEIKATNSRLDVLEKGLLDSPEKALSVPLLRNDLENLKLGYKQDMDNMAKGIDRVYDQNKWFLGLMFTMAVGLIAIAISNFVQSRKSG
jgi:FtsZ-binding cell division protein ZapB